MKKKTILLVATLFFLSGSVFNCKTEVRVKNECGYPIKNITVGYVSFSEEIQDGESTGFKEIEPGTYDIVSTGYYLNESTDKMEWQTSTSNIPATVSKYESKTIMLIH